MSLIAPIKPYIKYSMDMRQALPVVSYYCKIFAIQKGFEIVKSDTSGQDHSKIQAFLMQELTDAEEMKKSLPEGTSKAEHAYIVENFVLSQFTMVDKEERTCETITKSNALAFNRCSHFIMLLDMFDGLYDDEWESRRKYCVYKAGNILKCLKSGTQPPRGNPNDPNNDG